VAYNHYNPTINHYDINHELPIKSGLLGVASPQFQPLLQHCSREAQLRQLHARHLRRGFCSSDSETERDEHHGENLGKTWENAGKTCENAGKTSKMGK